jgi:hypothetical protein
VSAIPDAAEGALLRLHRRQFVIGPREFRARPDWIGRRIDAHTVLSHCPDLRVGLPVDADGDQWALLGLAVETREPGVPPVASIQQTTGAAVPGLYESWAGRWLLIGGGEVHLDATGLLACYYGAGSDGTTWASSSPALLASILQSAGKPLVADPRPLRYEDGVSWHPPPRSQFAGMHRLLPSQALAMVGSVRPRRLMPPIDPAMEYRDALDTLRRSMVNAWRGLAALGRPLWLGLSSGYDSRLVLATAHPAGVDVTLVTRISPRTSLGDRLIPPQLAAERGYRHVRLAGGAAQPGRTRLVDEHGGRGVSAGDAAPLVHGVRDGLTGIYVTGQCFAIGKLPFRGVLPGPLPAPEEGARRLTYLYRERPGSSAEVGFREWLEWVWRSPHGHLDWRDRFQIEQRHAGWEAAKEQVYDLASLERVALINAARNYALMLSIPEHKRRAAAYQVELIRALSPALLNYPINPPNRHFGMARQLITRVRHLGDTCRVAQDKTRRAWRTVAALLGR